MFPNQKKENTITKKKQTKDTQSHNANGVSLGVHINHADREHPGSSLGMYGIQNEHTELKRQQQRSLT